MMVNAKKNTKKLGEKICIVSYKKNRITLYVLV